MTEPGMMEGGYSAPVFESQVVFRGVMDAMARPGHLVGDLPMPRPPAPLLPSAAAVALTLCDGDTPIWLDAPLAAAEAVRVWLGFHTGAPVVAVPGEAHFALVANPASLINLDNFAQGTQEYPDRSATLILSLATLAKGAPLILEGPGIETAAELAPDPMPRHFVEQWTAMHARFPRGIDMILASPEGIAALPRTTRVSPKEA